MKLEPGEILCPKCKGNDIVGKGKPTVFGCDKCNGKGKLDWIENVVGIRKPKSYSPLDNTNVKKLINDIEKTLQKYEFEKYDKTTMSRAQSCINSMLHKERDGHSIYDFNTNVIGNEIKICLQPLKTVDLINISMVIS